MDAPPIQYAKTADGVSIAFWTLGEGPPLVVLPNLFASHVQVEWEWDVRRIAYERMSQRATVIHYDCRGLGLSQRDHADCSAEAGGLDLEAVVDRLGLERFAIFGSNSTGDVTLAYPADHPERVSHLIISVPHFSDTYPRLLAAIQPLIDQEWELYAEIWARIVTGWDSPLAAQLAAVVVATHVTSSSFRSALDAWAAFPPERYLASIEAPSLIMHPLQSGQDNRPARVLAGGIAEAHMVGILGWPFASTLSETVVNAILNFINTAPAAPGAPIPPPQVDISAVRTIVFTDVEGSTALNERLGDEGARKVLREHERLTREALGEHGGSEVKAMGDGFMAWFPSVTRAVECAIALQRAFADRENAVWAPLGDVGGAGGAAHGVGRGETPVEPLRIRVGINAGEPIAEGDDLFGASIIATARIAAQASGGQILASDVVRQLLAGKGFTFADQGEHALKGFDEPARLYEVRWQAA